MSDQEDSQMQQGYNHNYNQAGALSIRLDTTKILMDMELNLKGIRRTYEFDEETGEIISTFSEKGKALANAEGVQAIMNQVGNIVNSAFVQGNIQREQYFNFLQNVHEQLADMIMVGAPDWEINDIDMRPIVNMIVNGIEGFASRLVDNKERESYDTKITSSEVVTQREKGGLFSK